MFLNRQHDSGGRDENLFLAANFISSLGNGIQIIGAAFIVLIRTNSPLSVGGLFIVAALPQALLSLVSGNLADRGYRKSLCIASDLIRAVCVAAIPIALATGEAVVPVLYTATFIVAMFDSVFQPVGSSWMQNLIDRDSYARFNSRFEVSTQVGMLLSAALGGFFIQWFSASAVFAFNAATFVASAALLAFMASVGRATTTHTTPETPSHPVPAQPRVAWWRSSPAILMFAQGRIIPTVMNTLLIVLVIKTFQQTMGMLGVIDALAGVGFTCGALAYGVLNRKLTGPAILVAGSIVTALFIMPQPFGGIGGLMLTFVLACTAFGTSRVASRTVLMDTTDDRAAGRVFGAANAIGFVVAAAGTLVISRLIEGVSIQAAYLAVGGYLAVVSILSAIPLLRPTPTPVPEPIPLEATPR